MTSEFLKEYWWAVTGGAALSIPVALGALKYIAKQIFNVFYGIIVKFLSKKLELSPEQLKSTLPGLFKFLLGLGGQYKQKIDWIFETLALSIPTKIESPSYNEAQTERLKELEAQATELGAKGLGEMADIDIDPQLSKAVIKAVSNFIEDVKVDENR